MAEQGQVSNHAGNATYNRQSSLLVVSLHSCGNLSHHALRALVSNHAVRAVAVIGCCYNLLTERFGPPTYKSEELRPCRRNDAENSMEHGDAQGFPMSDMLVKYQSPTATGISFNITARMMAVQAPTNWTKAEADLFFTRHFFRALLQRVLVDRGIVNTPSEAREHDGSAADGGLQQPIIIGSMSKGSYRDFKTYGRAAIARIENSDQLIGDRSMRLHGITDEQLEEYENEYRSRRKDVGIVWTLMALSATLVEATVVVDRWQWLREQGEVARCWVEPVFDYKQSPRNLVVVGVKARDGG